MIGFRTDPRARSKSPEERRVSGDFSSPGETKERRVIERRERDEGKEKKVTCTERSMRHGTRDICIQIQHKGTGTIEKWYNRGMRGEQRQHN